MAENSSSQGIIEKISSDKRYWWLILGCIVTLVVVRVGFVSYFDSAATRFACLNHANYMNEQILKGKQKVDLSEAQIEELRGEPLEWSVRRHIRSNKLGLINRDTGKCVFVSNVTGVDEMEVLISDAQVGGFYYFAKLMGILLQVGLVSGFIRWYVYRFFD